MRVYSIAYLLFTCESTYAALDKTVNCLRRRPKAIRVYITSEKRQNHAAHSISNIMFRLKKYIGARISCVLLYGMV